MRISFFSSLLFGVLLVLFGFVPPTQARGFNRNHPCHNIKVACEAAGFTRGTLTNENRSESRGRWVDCLSKVRAGTPVPGVAILPTEVDACNARIAAKK